MPVTIPGNLSGRASRSAPAAHSALAAVAPKHANAPAVASASKASAGAPVRRVKSSRSANGLHGALVVDAVEQRVGQPAHVPQPDAHRVDRRVGVPARPAALRPAPPPAVRGSSVQSRRDARDARAEHLDPVTHRVAHDRVR